MVFQAICLKISDSYEVQASTRSLDASLAKVTEISLISEYILVEVCTSNVKVVGLIPRECKSHSG